MLGRRKQVYILVCPFARRRRPRPIETIDFITSDKGIYLPPFSRGDVVFLSELSPATLHSIH